MTDIQRNRAFKKLQDIRALEKENKELGEKARKAQKRFRSHSQSLGPKREELYSDMERMLT